MDILLNNLKAHIEAEVLKAQREEKNAYIKNWRTENKEKHRQYANMKNREYYALNKAKFNKRRNEQYHKKKERDRLADLAVTV